MQHIPKKHAIARVKQGEEEFQGTPVHRTHLQAIGFILDEVTIVVKLTSAELVLYLTPGEVKRVPLVSKSTGAQAERVRTSSHTHMFTYTS